MFDGESSWTRLRLLGRILEDSAPPAEQLDALLFVGGADGCFNSLSQSAIKFLLEGSGGEHLQLGGDCLLVGDSEPLEDCFIVLRRDHATASFHVHFWYGGAERVRKLVEPIAASWSLHARVTEHRLLPHEASDVDGAELRKIRAFIIATRGCQRVGIPVGSPMEAELWPLVQAVAVEGVAVGGGSSGDGGQRGFFTMSHSVVDVRAEVRAILASIDASSLAQTLGIDPTLISNGTSTGTSSANAADHGLLHRMQHQWQAMLHKIDRLSADGRLNLTQAAVAEDLVSYYEYGREAVERAEAESDVVATTDDGRGINDVDNDIDGVATSVVGEQHAYVRFGGWCCGVSAASDGSWDDPNRTIGGQLEGKDSVCMGRDSGLGPALLLRARSSDAGSGVRLARTYFLGVGSSIMEIHASDDDAGEAADSVAVRSLMNSYTLLVAALDAAACAATRVLCYDAHQAHVDGIEEGSDDDDTENLDEIGAIAALAHRRRQRRWRKHQQHCWQHHREAACAAARAAAVTLEPILPSAEARRAAGMRITMEPINAVGASPISAHPRMAYVELSFVPLIQRTDCGLVVGDTFVFAPDVSPAETVAVTRTALLPLLRAWRSPGVEEAVAADATRAIRDRELLQSLGLGDAVGRRQPRRQLLFVPSASTVATNAPHFLPLLPGGTLQLYAGGFVFFHDTLIKPLVVSMAKDASAVAMRFSSSRSSGGFSDSSTSIFQFGGLSFSTSKILSAGNDACETGGDNTGSNDDGDHDDDGGHAVLDVILQYAGADGPLKAVLPSASERTPALGCDVGRVGIVLDSASLLRDIKELLPRWRAALNVGAVVTDVETAISAYAPARSLLSGGFSAVSNSASGCARTISRMAFLRAAVLHDARETEDKSTESLSDVKSTAISTSDSTAVQRPSIAVFVGVAGSGVTSMAEAVCTASAHDFRWLVLHLDDDDIVALEATVSTILDAAIEVKRATDAPGTLPMRMMLVVQCQSDVGPLLRRLNLEPMRSWVKPAAHTTVVSATHLYSDARCTQLLPGLLAQAASTTNTIITNAAAAPDEAASFRRRLRACSPQTTVLRLAGEALTFSGDDLEPILRMEGGRGASASGARSGSSANVGAIDVLRLHPVDGDGILRSMNIVRVTRVLRALFPAAIVRPAEAASSSILSRDTARQTSLHSSYTCAFDEAEADSRAARARRGDDCTSCGGHSVLVLQGLLPVASTAGASESHTEMMVEATAAQIRWRRPSQSEIMYWRQKSKKIQGAAAVQSDVAIVEVHGMGMQPTAMHALLELFFTPSAKPVEFRTVDSVTEDERSRIHEERKREPLPPGWYFDGSRYISANLEGSSLLHPSIDAFVQDFVDKENHAIEKYNAAIANGT